MERTPSTYNIVVAWHRDCRTFSTLGNDLTRKDGESYASTASCFAAVLIDFIIVGIPNRGNKEPQVGPVRY